MWGMVYELWLDLAHLKEDQEEELLLVSTFEQFGYRNC